MASHGRSSMRYFLISTMGFVLIIALGMLQIKYYDEIRPREGKMRLNSFYDLEGVLKFELKWSDMLLWMI